MLESELSGLRSVLVGGGRGGDGICLWEMTTRTINAAYEMVMLHRALLDEVCVVMIPPIMGELIESMR